MLTQLLHLFFATFLTFLLYPLWIKFVYKYQMREEVRTDGPQTHIVKKGTPTMGGLVFILSVSLITFIFNRYRTQTLFPIFVATLSGLFGITEDFVKVYKYSFFSTFFKKKEEAVEKKSPSKFNPWHYFTEFWRVVGSDTGRGPQTYQKFLFQAAIGGFVAYWTYFKLGWDYLWMPLIGNIHLGLFYPVLIFFLFIAVLNCVAFTDGLDGLAGRLSLIAFCAYWVISFRMEYIALSAFCATFVGALIPFLYFNVYPARVFMGNVGSHVLGATMAILAVVLHREVALLPILAVFLVDGASSPLQQLSVRLTGKRIFRMAPLHHHFELLGWPETKVTFRFWIFGIFFAFVGIFVALL
ncbi:MAG: phospho-N-acetylmuramoyl-pentapeptide-transferase [Patescibacteria group bacterium]|jgi:phospho-N-acetylmuramoyl-pentapeptide-transferase